MTEIIYYDASKQIERTAKVVTDAVLPALDITGILTRLFVCVTWLMLKILVIRMIVRDWEFK